MKYVIVEETSMATCHVQKVLRILVRAGGLSHPKGK
jgi:hypothetical protein